MNLKTKIGMAAVSELLCYISIWWQFSTYSVM